MKYINKQNPPESFIKYIKNKTSSYKDISNQNNIEVKNQLKNALLNEQGFICCYCGIEIDKDKSVIEHVLDKSKHPNLQLFYHNLACSCKGGQDKRNKNPCYPLCCDASKGNKEIYVTPFDKECNSKFEYDEDGNIWGLDDNAKKTIEVLNLNNIKLKNMRKSAIDVYRFLDYNSSQWNEELERLESRCFGGKFLPFCFVIINYIENYIIK